MTALRWLLRIAIGIVAVVALIFFAARLHDGPLGPVPGGSLEAGPEVAEPVADWSFVKDVGEVELQLASQGTSRTTWILWHEGHAYVPCSLGFPPMKSWHHDAAADGRATLRIDGKRYPVLLSKLPDAEVQAMAEPIRAEVARKYGEGPPSDAGVWLFRVTSRAPAS
jgi:hypothetical protein